jgi:hypothetical protein
MTDTGVTLKRLGLQPCFEIPELAFCAAAFEMIAFQRCNAGGIVSPIFETFERIHQLLCDRSAPENADNAAHSDQFPQVMKDAPCIS